ncbi:MAG: hypothetical protein LBB22_01645 [Treponema sp.]|nr:hypothetical protein [Treponema sp.]
MLRRVTPACLLAATLTSCAGFGQPETGGGDLTRKTQSEKYAEIVKEQRREDAALLKELPVGVSDYLLKLAAAFAVRDAGFLLSQGEDEYETLIRNNVSAGEYLAMLYRAGAFADDAPWGSPRELDLNRIAYIDYTEWRERGPILEVDGKIYMDSGHPLIFSVKVLWRLSVPKILGAYP